MRTSRFLRGLAVTLVAASSTLAPTSVAAQRGAGASAVHIPFERYTLPNGLTVILSEDHTTPTVAVDVWYHVGSKNEKPGRTGFAHLFEHIMFTGSGHVPYGMHDRYTEGVGGGNNGSTTNDRTNYFETVPSNYLEDELWLESDRMGWLLDALDVAKLDAQRDIVKNERRQSYDNRPYGRAGEIISGAMYPPDHPYHWPVIGSMADLSAASADDVKSFFRLYYAPNNATLAVVGDFDPAQAKTWIAKYFGEIPRGAPITRPVAPVVTLPAETRLVYEDRVQVPRLYLAWPTVGVTSADQYALDILSAVLSGSRTARLTKGLVYDRQSAAEVTAWQDENELVGTFEIIVTPRPGNSLTRLELTTDSLVDRLKREGPTARELQKVKAGLELRAISRLQSNLAKADILDEGSAFHDDPAFFQTDLARTQAVSADDVKRVANQYLTDGRVVLSIVPQGKPEMASKPDQSTRVSQTPASPTSGREGLR
jgi:zinc protease